MAQKRGRETWGALRKLPSGRWQARYIGADGKGYSARTPADKPLTFDGKETARAWLRRTRQDIEAGTWLPPAERARQLDADAKKAAAAVFGSYARSWVATRVNSKGAPLRPRTRAEYIRYLDRGLAEFEGDQLADITKARVRVWHARRAKTAPTAAGVESRFLSAVMNTAVEDGLIDTNPVDGKLRRTARGVKHRPPTPEELAVLLDKIGDRFRFAVLLGAYGGLRLSEWRALRRRDITYDGERWTVSVTRSAVYVPGDGFHVGPPKSSAGIRDVSLPVSLNEQVRTALADVGPFPDSLVFAPQKGAEFVHDSEFNRAWNAARVAAGVRVKGKDGTWRNTVREHDLRAYAGTAYAQSGATLRETMQFLGHGSVAAAMAYQHSTGRAAELADRMPTLPAPKELTPTPITKEQEN